MGFQSVAVSAENSVLAAAGANCSSALAVLGVRTAERIAGRQRQTPQ